MAHDAALREMIDLAARFGANWGLVFDYTECFRQETWGSVREQKRLRLLKEVWQLFQKCEFEIDGKRYRTDWPRIIAAIRAVTDADKFGFKNHNYLKRVLLGEKAERLSAEGLTAAEEQKREDSRRLKIDDGRLTIENQQSEITAGEQEIRRGHGAEGRELTAQEYKAKKGIESLADQIGKGINDC
jgi:hypothetical protein